MHPPYCLSFPLLLLNTLHVLLPIHAATIPTPHHIVNTTHPHVIPLPCNNITEPCHCPNGSMPVMSATSAVIGASARAVAGVMNNFFNTTWSGQVLLNTTGRAEVLGATRTFGIGGGVTLTEELVVKANSPDGSFIEEYRQIQGANLPIPFPLVRSPNSTSAREGYWETIDVTQTAVHDESSVLFSVFRCDIGDPFDSEAFHASAINTTIRTLKQEGKLTGKIIWPHPVESIGSSVVAMPKTSGGRLGG